MGESAVVTGCAVGPAGLRGGRHEMPATVTVRQRASRSLQLAGELLRREPAQEVLGVGQSRFRLSRRLGHGVGCRLQSIDQLVRLGPCELARSLALREAHRSRASRKLLWPPPPAAAPAARPPDVTWPEDRRADQTALPQSTPAVAQLRGILQRSPDHDLRAGAITATRGDDGEVGDDAHEQPHAGVRGRRGGARLQDAVSGRPSRAEDVSHSVRSYQLAGRPLRGSRPVPAATAPVVTTAEVGWWIAVATCASCAGRPSPCARTRR